MAIFILADIDGEEENREFLQNLTKLSSIQIPELLKLIGEYESNYRVIPKN